MFSQLSILAALASYASAAIMFTVTPTNWDSTSPVTVNWTSTESDDPSLFSLELNNPALFNKALALANNVPTLSLSITFTLPAVPAAPGYNLLAVDVSNITDIFATGADFSIALPPNVTSSSSSSSTTSTSSGTGTSSSTGTVSPTTSTTPFGTTVSSTSTPGTSSSSSGSGSGVPSPTPSSFNGNGAMALSTSGMTSWVVLGLGAVLGGMFVL